MPKTQLNHKIIGNLTSLSLEDLRQKWAITWGQQPHARIGRTMLLKSLEYKILEQETGTFTSEQRQRLEQLIKSYKRNPNYFDENVPALKPGTRLVRNWNGKRYSVLVQNAGYEYKSKIYGSLSQVAFEITGTRWNGWVFFGLKKKEVTT
ncbi:MAG: DUF2924 domain-containing protein [Alphaproteobacteria bacterium PRO2]|nr:DUF2924 domain-containing protein [Alphaproteobacteria bacterium PRO2]